MVSFLTLISVGLRGLLSYIRLGLGLRLGFKLGGRLRIRVRIRVGIIVRFRAQS